MDNLKEQDNTTSESIDNKDTEKTPEVYFEDLDLSDNVLDALYDMRFEKCTPVQAQCIPPILEHQMCGAAQVECAKLQVGNETARCGEHNVGSSLQRTALLFIAYAIVATIHGYGINSCVVGKALKCLVYLACQLARWGNDQAVYGVGGVGGALKQSEQRQQVGCRLARTRLGHAKHIVVLKNGRYTLCLYWCAFFKPHVVECVEHVV
jgi:hypothetical protein